MSILATWHDYYTGTRGFMEIHLDELLYPERLVKEYPITQVRKIFKLIRKNTDPETWVKIREYIEGRPVRRYKKYLEIWEAIK